MFRNVLIYLAALAMSMATLAGVATTAVAQPVGTGPDAEREAAAAAATGRWAERYGVYRTNDRVRVSSYGPSADPVFITFTNDVQVVSNLVERAGDGGVAISGTFKDVSYLNVAAYASSGAGWQLMASACQSREQNSTGYIDVCWKKYRLTNDGDGQFDYWVWNQYATAKSTGIFTLSTAWGKSWKNTAQSYPWYWVDWSPNADLTLGNCSNVTVGVSYIVELSATYTACDRWDITKSATAGTFQNYWRGSAYRSERAVAHMTMIKLAQGQTPSYYFDHGFSAL